MIFVGFVGDFFYLFLIFLDFSMIFFGFLLVNRANLSATLYLKAIQGAKTPIPLINEKCTVFCWISVMCNRILARIMYSLSSSSSVEIEKVEI